MRWINSPLKLTSQRPHSRTERPLPRQDPSRKAPQVPWGPATDAATTALQQHAEATRASVTSLAFLTTRSIAVSGNDLAHLLPAIQRVTDAYDSFYAGSPLPRLAGSSDHASAAMLALQHQSTSTDEALNRMSTSGVQSLAGFNSVVDLTSTSDLKALQSAVDKARPHLMR